jgi:O-methyltransferase involved in polyketide biosynthesis
MKKKQASITAQGIAFAQALESSKPEGERFCYDPLARRLINYRVLKLGGIVSMMEEFLDPDIRAG